MSSARSSLRNIIIIVIRDTTITITITITIVVISTTIITITVVIVEVYPGGQVTEASLPLPALPAAHEAQMDG